MHAAPTSTIFFDAANTLVTLKKSVGHGYSAVARDFDLNLDLALTNAAFAAQWKKMPPYNPGKPQSDDGKSWWRALVNHVLDTLPLPPLSKSRRHEFFEALYAHYANPEQWTPCPDSFSVLEHLKANPQLRLGIISNFDRRLYRILEELGLRPFFDDIILSTEIGFSKPHPRIFSAACLRAGANPAECLHVGDDPDEDWEGARRAGLKVLTLDHREITLRHILDFSP